MRALRLEAPVSRQGLRNALWCVTAFGIVACAASALRPEHSSDIDAPAGSVPDRPATLPVSAIQTTRGFVVTLGDGLFASGHAVLAPDADPVIGSVADFLDENPERLVQVEAFTDSDGSRDYNLELSQSRADAVAMTLIRRGVDAERVRALGYGEGFPQASNASASGRQRNRRVEIIVSSDGGPIPGRPNRI